LTSAQARVGRAAGERARKIDARRALSRRDKEKGNSELFRILRYVFVGSAAK